MADSSSQPISFPQAISRTQSLIEQIDREEISETEIQNQVASFLESKNGGRGFFVAYLTSEISLADRPSSGIIGGLKAAKQFSSELLVKNLAMSAAMIVVHNRNSDFESMLGSERVYRRTRNLIQQLNLQPIKKKLQQLKTTIENGEGEYQHFLQRWNYDIEQKESILNAIESL